MTCGHEQCGLPLSRRHLLQAGPAMATGAALLAAAPPAVAAPSSAATAARSFGSSADYLAAAKSTADWILSTQLTDEHGIMFPADPAAPKRDFMSPTSPESFYCGMAGIILMFAELAQKTGEARYREAAIAGADRLLRRWPALAENPTPYVDMRWGMVFGISGVGMALYQVGQMLSEPRFSAALGPIADRIVQGADPSNPKGTWTPSAGYLTDASTVLYLVKAGQILRQRKYLEMARKAGDRLIALATREPDGSLAWRGPQNISLPHLYYPNFELGTAGIAYTLAALHEATGDPRYLEAAKGGAAHLMNLAVHSGDAALVPYALPDFADIFYLGFCHGAAGTARTFYLLHKLTGDRRYLDFTQRLARGVLAAGAPELESPGMWNTVTQCCGVASQVTLFLGLWATYGDPAHLEVARRAGRVITSRADNQDGKGNKYFMAWQRIVPSVVNTETGYMIGAAGIATALLHLHTAVEGRYEVSLPFDNPYPTRRTVV